MNQWPSGQANGMFSQPGQGHINPANMYNNLPGGPNQFDLNQFTQGLQNGNTSSSPTPGFSNQHFQLSSVVPAKRSHDGMSESPVQNHGSRSQTPSYAAFQNQQAGAQQFPNAPTPYAHLQQSNSNNATPSPTMQNQQFRPPQQQQQQQQQPRMQNASPSPFPQNQGHNFGNQMSPTQSQNPNQPSNMASQNQMGGFNPQFGMNANASMSGMPNAMSGQMNNMSQMNAQRAYQMKLMQHQQQLRNSGIIPPRAMGGQQNQMSNTQQQQPQTQQLANGQAAGQMSMAANQQQNALKRAQFLKTIAGHAASQGRQFNPAPAINGKGVDLFQLWTLVTQVGGSATVERSGQWQQIATRMGFPEQQFPTAASDLRQLHATNVAQYERLWFAMRAQQKQEEARVHAQQMAGLGGPPQGSPTKPMPQMAQQDPYAPHLQPGQRNQMQPQSTPLQANAQLPQNGMVTPQQQMLQHRRNSSVRKPEQMTPQVGAQPFPAPSPLSVDKPAQRPPSSKQEPAPPAMKSEETRSTQWIPTRSHTTSYGGYDMPSLVAVGKELSALIPTAPTVDEMGVIDIKAITLSLASGIHGEVRYALDALSEITHDPRIMFDLTQSQDLFDIIIDCAEAQVELLSNEAVEVSDALDLAPYEDIIRAGRIEAETLQEVPEFGTHAFSLDRAAERLVAISTILRNLSFYEANHVALTSTPLIKWFSNVIRLLGTRNMLLRTFLNTQDFYKDMIILLSNITQSLELPSRDDALHILHFLLAFAPQPAPSYTGARDKIRFTSYSPYAHRYLPPAVDSLAKLLARQDPNRMLYKNIFSASSSSLAVSESPLDLLTRAFALSIAVLPDRTKVVPVPNASLRICEARKAYMSQGMLAADILSTLVPANDSDLARAWIGSEDGWAAGLLNLAATLSVDKSVQAHQQPPGAQKRPGEPGFDYDSFKLIAQRALAMMKRLAEKAGRGAPPPPPRRRAFANSSANGLLVNGDGPDADGDADEDDAAVAAALNCDALPYGHNVIGALTLLQTDKVALGLMCGLHEMTMMGD